MKRLALFAAIALVAMSAFAQGHRVVAQDFATDATTIPVMGNTPGFGGATFQTYVALLNPTASSFAVQVSLFDTAGTKRDASITLAAGEQKVYQNFLAEVFNFTGGGAVTFRAADSAGGQRNNRFIISTEVRTSGTRYSTTIPSIEFAGSSSRSFVAGITVDSNTRTNVGCFNQSGAANSIKATILDTTGKLTIGSVTLNLPANAWGQTAVTSIVSNGYVQFDPTDSAVCYAVVVDNATSDGRFMSAAEYRP